MTGLNGKSKIIAKEGILMNTKIGFSLTDDDWFSQGKNDAWSGRTKQAPIEDPSDASQYDLGYSEGSTRNPPIIGRTPSQFKRP
jgi:hypothetical protein